LLHLPGTLSLALRDGSVYNKKWESFVPASESIIKGSPS